MKTINRYYPFLVAGAFSIGTVLAAAWPRFGSNVAVYDAHLAVVAITAVAVIWYTAFTFETLRTIGRTKRETRDERRTQLENLVLRTIPVLGRLIQTRDTDEILRRVGWLRRKEEELDVFVGLDGARYAQEVRQAADALNEFRTETEAVLRRGDSPDAETLGEPDQLSRALDRTKEALARLYSVTSGEPYEDLIRGIPQ